MSAIQPLVQRAHEHSPGHDVEVGHVQVTDHDLPGRQLLRRTGSGWGW